MLVLRGSCKIIHRVKGGDHGSEESYKEDFEEGCKEGCEEGRCLSMRCLRSCGYSG